MEKLFRAALAVMFCVLAQTASALASPVTWTLTNATFDTGGSVTGSFTWDADTYSLTNVSIQISGGSDPTIDGSLTTGALILPGSDLFVFFEPPGPHDPAIWVEPDSLLTDAGGTVELDSTSGVGLCGSAGCTGMYRGQLPSTVPLSGSLVAGPSSSSVPEPSTLPLLLIGFMGLASARWAVWSRSTLLKTSRVRNKAGDNK